MADYVATGNPPFINVKLSLPEWNTYVANYDFGPVPPSRVVLHHTWRPTVAQWKGLTSMKGMQAYYAGLGWTAAPHIYAGPDGIWLATPMREVGIHAGTGNSGVWDGKWSYSIGLEMVGDYDTQRPSGAVWEHAKAVMGGLARRLGIAPRKLIFFHRDFSAKSCPGWAVTKEWVWGEVEAWMNNVAPPPPPSPGSIGVPPPDIELLIESLLNASYQRAGGYSSELAFYQYAVEKGMGFPIARAARIRWEGKEYTYQPFARDTLFCEVPKWGEVRRLDELLGGSIPPSGLGRMLLEATYKACGATFRPDWAFHQYALSAKMGPPIGGSSTIQVDGKTYSYQTFARDTLYNLNPNWGDVRQLSRLSTATDASTVRLREALLEVTYRSGGATYRPDWMFHQIARTLNGGEGIGAPLSESYRIAVGDVHYAIQVYALDTLYNQVPDWGNVHRLSDLIRTKAPPRPVATAATAATATTIITTATAASASSSTTPATLGVAVSHASATAQSAVTSGAPSRSTPGAPSQPTYEIVRYFPPSMSFSSREGATISMVIITSDTHPSQETLRRMTTIGSRVSAHYYLTLDGTIYQLVDERDAAWHSGMVTLQGIWFNLNRISIGIMLEGLPDAENLNEEHPEAQLSALRWLLKDLVKRYKLGPESIVLAGPLASSKETMSDRLFLNEIFAQ